MMTVVRVVVSASGDRGFETSVRMMDIVGLGRQICRSSSSSNALHRYQ
jgi:hypothetical protein